MVNLKFNGYKPKKSVICTVIFSSILMFFCSCGSPAQKRSESKTNDSNGLGPTIAMLTEVFASDSIPVKGYGLIGGLNGTGSSECPAPVRAYLEKYILQHLSGSKVNVDELISSPDTAVVVVEGIIPPAAFQNQQFDIRVIALTGSQTTSLEGGWLYGADLYDARQLGLSIKSLANTEGPVYVDLLASDVDARTGYIIGGGSVSDTYKINLALRQSDYMLASQIRNRINERFGNEIAWALTAGSIELRVPSKYNQDKSRFIRLVGAMYLTDIPELMEKRVMAAIQKLIFSPDKYAAEITLESIGNDCLPKVSALLNAYDPEVRMRAARCMLNLGDNRGREALWNIASDKTSPYRLEAIEAVANSAPKQDASSLFRRLLQDDDLSIRYAACDNLIKFNDVIVNQKLIAGSFYLNQIAQSGKPAIFVSRSEQPRVILLGAPLYCRDDVYIESKDGSITINVPPEERMATIIRRHPKRPDTVIHLQSSLDLSDIIETLCKEPVARPDQGRPGLGVPYSTLVAMLNRMVDSGAVDAQFQAGTLPKSFPIVKK